MIDARLQGTVEEEEKVWKAGDCWAVGGVERASRAAWKADGEEFDVMAQRFVRTRKILGCLKQKEKATN